jgi:hypothetical protein
MMVSQQRRALTTSWASSVNDLFVIITLAVYFGTLLEQLASRMRVDNCLLLALNRKKDRIFVLLWLYYEVC